MGCRSQLSTVALEGVNFSDKLAHVLSCFVWFFVPALPGTSTLLAPADNWRVWNYENGNICLEDKMLIQHLLSGKINWVLLELFVLQSLSMSQNTGLVIEIKWSISQTLSHKFFPHFSFFFISLCFLGEGFNTKFLVVVWSCSFKN